MNLRELLEKATPLPWYAKPTACGSQGLIVSENNGNNVAVTYAPEDAILIAHVLSKLQELIDTSSDLLDNTSTSPVIVATAKRRLRRALQDIQNP